MEQEERPWGKFEVLLDAEDCKVKRITVKEGQRLSYQSHEHRSETWTVVKGRAVVTLDGGDRVLEERETVYKEGELIGNLGDVHIYLNQIEGVKEQMTREPRELPQLEVSNVDLLAE